jgi:hypothetical protein
MAKVKVGDQVKALRSHNKAIELIGEVTKVDGNSVTINVESAAGAPLDHDDHHETVHIDDVTVLETKKAAAKN